MYAAALEGIHLEVRINYDQCNDPTGSGLDFTGVTGGAYLQEMVINNPDSNDPTINGLIIHDKYAERNLSLCLNVVYQVVGGYKVLMLPHLSPGLDSSIFTAAYSFVSNYITGEGFGYNSVDITMDQNGAIVAPALWSVENGELTNLLGDQFYLECTFGEGLIIYASRQD